MLDAHIGSDPGFALFATRVVGCQPSGFSGQLPTLSAPDP